MVHTGSSRFGRAWSSASRRAVLPAACALALAGLAACGSSTGTGSAASSASASSAATGSPSADSGSGATTATEATIMIHTFAYQTPASVSPGATVSVMNMDGEAHTVTADSGNAFDDQAAAGTTTTFTAPSTPGSYPFHCAYHGNMHGVLVVK